MSDPRVVHIVFCDDIRFEIGNKISLMGMYSGDMIFPQEAPVMLPRLGCAVYLITDVDDPPKRVVITVRIPDAAEGTEVAKIEVNDIGPLQNAEGAVKANFRSIIQLGPLPLTHPGYLEVWLETELGKMRAGRIRLVFSPTEAAKQIQEGVAAVADNSKR